MRLEPPDEPVTDDEVRWNTTNGWLQATLASDGAFQGCTVDMRQPPRPRLHIVVEPGESLSANTLAVIEEAGKVIPLDINIGPTPRAELETALKAVQDAATRVGSERTSDPSSARPTRRRGAVVRLTFGIDWLRGVIQFTGDTAYGQRIAEESGVDRRLLAVDSTSPWLPRP